jgi:hypothetical protein
MLRSSALLGLAALAQAEIIVNTPAPGYGSTTVNAFNQDQVQFQYDLNKWATDNYDPTFQPRPDGIMSTWDQVLAFKIEKDFSGEATSLAINWNDGSSIATTLDFIDDKSVSPAKWYCISTGTGTGRDWMKSTVTVDLTVSCSTSNGCINTPDPLLQTTGADFRVTAFFYRVPASIGGIQGWGQDACAGGAEPNSCWDSQNNRIKDKCRDTTDRALDEPYMSVDPVFRDGLSEAFTASWETLNGGLSGSVINNGWQTAPVRKSNNDEWLVGNQMVLDATSITTEGLYSRVSGQGDGNGATFMWCFTSNQNRGMRPNGNYRYSAYDLVGACDLGCYPEAADGSCMKPTGLTLDPSLMDYKIKWDKVQDGNYNIIASVLVSDNYGTSQAPWISPDHLVCFAWGHQCSGASTAGPSAVLAMAALYLASRA